MLSNENKPNDFSLLTSSIHESQCVIPDELHIIPDKAFTLRRATNYDFPAIKNLIDAVEINPMGLDWRRFIIAVDKDDHLVGCGQVKQHKDGSLELASIAVQPDWRKQGVARAIVCSDITS